MKSVVLDGQFYAQRLTGQYRYANEILKELDCIINKGEFKLIIPNYVANESYPKFKNIEVIKYGNVKGVLWTQTSLLHYIIKNKCISVGFCNTTPLLKRGITVVYDIGYKDLKTHYKNLYGRLSSLWHRLNYWMIAKSNKPIISISEFSKLRIIDVYKVNANRITVVDCAWQQYNKIVEDDNIFNEYPNIKKGEYFFAVGSLEERKNFKWIIEIAKRNKDKLFVIAGGSVKNATNEMDFSGVNNLIFVGFVSDGYVKSLMKYCRCFLFPSTYEGFGIPPLEAMSVGADVICANVSAMPEICGKSVHYIDPDDYEVDINKLLEEPVENKEKILEKYSWRNSAEIFKSILDKYKQIGGHVES